LLLHYLGAGDAMLPNFLRDLGLRSIGELDSEGLQSLNDSFCGFILEKIEEARDGKDLSNKFVEIDIENAASIEVTDLQGRTTTLPNWYLKSNGHKIEEALVYCFPRLKQYKNEAGKLMNEICIHVYDSTPGLIPFELAASISKVQKSG
jgi:hypothetical protein